MVYIYIRIGITYLYRFLYSSVVTEVRVSYHEENYIRQFRYNII